MEDEESERARATYCTRSVHPLSGLKNWERRRLRWDRPCAGLSPCHPVLHTCPTLSTPDWASIPLQLVVRDSGLPE